MEAKFWYVFDEADCIDKYETVYHAGLKAEEMVVYGFNGIHILYLTQAEFDEYCKTNKFPFAK
jgi:hypothetical protein